MLSALLLGFSLLVGATAENIHANFCNLKKNGNHPSPNDGCKGYIHCWNYNARYFTCPDGYLFNAKAGYCDKAVSVNCPQDILECDAGIVGGGISGLYMAYTILKNNSNNKVCIFEKESHVGGRIRDHHFKEAPNIDVGLGALIVDTNHVNILALLKELNITIEKWVLWPKLIKSRGIAADNTEDIKEGFPVLRANPKFGNLTSRELYKYLLKPENVAKAKTYATFNTYISDLITLEGLNYLNGLTHHNFKYDEPLGAQQRLRDDLSTKIPSLSLEFFKPHGGMSSIIKGLYDNVKAFKGNIYISAEVKSISKEDSLYIIQTTNLKVKAKKLIMATPPRPFRTITGGIAKKIQETAQLNSFLQIPVFRGVAVYKTPWWESVKIGKTFVKANQYFVSRDDCMGGSMAYRYYGPNGEGVLQTVYCDGPCSQKWKDIADLKTNYIDVEVHRALEAKYGVQIPKPLNTVYQYWNEAFDHPSRPDSPFSKSDISDWAKRPFTDENIFLVGTAYSLLSNWSEGALMSCRNALKEGWGIEK